MTAISIQVSDHDGAFPHFSNPQHIGEFSLDKQRQVVADRSQLKYLNKRSVNEHPIEMDLNDGYRRFEQKDPLQQETLDTFLQWIMLTSKMNVPLRTGNSDDGNIRVLLAVVHNADIVCWRGALTKIAATPYEQREGWRMACIRHAGVIFICEYRTQEKRRSIENMTAKEKLMSYWGVKFEQYMTTTAIAHTQDDAPDTRSPVNNFEQYCVVVRSRLGDAPGVRLLFAGEVDCIDDRDGKYIELKTQREFDKKSQQNNFWRFKAIKWWLQSFLIGITNIMVGYRDDSGIVRRVSAMSVDEIAKKSREYWSASISFNFLLSVLNMVKQTMTCNDASRVLLIEWQPNWTSVRVKHVVGTEFAFMPRWFIERFPQ